MSLDDLLEHPWTEPSLPPRMCDALTKVDKPFATFDSDLKRLHPRALVETFAAAKQIVLHGAAIGAAIPYQIELEVRLGLCVQFPIEFPWLALDYGFVYKNGRKLSPAAEAFMDAVRAIESNIP